MDLVHGAPKRFVQDDSGESVGGLKCSRTNFTADNGATEVEMRRASPLAQLIRRNGCDLIRLNAKGDICTSEGKLQFSKFKR